MADSSFGAEPAGGTFGGPGQTLIASFDTYPAAQRLVEQVTGRMTKGRAAMAGAGSGAWIGLFIGLLFGLFAVGPFWLWAVLVSLAIGVVFGAVFGFVAHWATQGRRDFSSIYTLQAQRYDVYVDAAYAAQAEPFRVQPG